jgi:hypothetical protein
VPADAEGGTGPIAHEPRGGVVLVQHLRKLGKVVLQSSRATARRAELPARIRVDQIVALVVDQVDAAAVRRSRANTGKGRPQIDVNDHHPKRRAVGVMQRRGDAQDRNSGRLDDAILPVEFDRRDIDLAGAQPGRFLQCSLIGRVDAPGRERSGRRRRMMPSTATAAPKPLTSARAARSPASSSVASTWVLASMRSRPRGSASASTLR